MAESHTYSKRRISSPERLRHPSRPAQREPFLFLESPMSELTLTRFATRLRVSLPGWRCPAVVSCSLSSGPGTGKWFNSPVSPKAAMRSECVIAAWCPAQPSASWEVWNDPGRTFTMLHPANTMDNLQAASAQGPTLGYNCGNGPSPTAAVPSAGRPFSFMDYIPPCLPFPTPTARVDLPNTIKSVRGYLCRGRSGYLSY